MIVNHQANELNWLKYQQVLFPKTLVLGSFNPFNPSGANSVDYYYGRHSNYFWRTIANIGGHSESYYFDISKGLDRKRSVINNRFVCLDVIDSIEISSQNEDILNEYLSKEIFSNYLDQTIWKSKTNYPGNSMVTLRRNYNQSVLNALTNSDSIKRVVHTMGNNRLSIKNCSPKEKSLGDFGFHGFIHKVFNLCNNRGIEFVDVSYSPSEYAVKTGKTDKLKLAQWLAKNLDL